MENNSQNSSGDVPLRQRQGSSYHGFAAADSDTINSGIKKSDFDPQNLKSKKKGQDEDILDEDGS